MHHKQFFFCLFFLSLQPFVSLCRPVKEIVEDIRQGNWLRFGTGKLKELCKLLPEESEVTAAPFFSSLGFNFALLCSELA